jgi:hypothetical protein
MSEPKGTQGPWEVNDQRASGWMNNAIYVGSANTGQIIARVYNDTGNAEADAYKLAAAHDLYEALQEIINTPWIGGKGGFVKARAALAKARGEQ